VLADVYIYATHSVVVPLDLHLYMCCVLSDIREPYNFLLRRIYYNRKAENQA